MKTLRSFLTNLRVAVCLALLGVMAGPAFAPRAVALETISFSDEIEPKLAPWDDFVEVSQFDPQLGTLVSAKLKKRITIEPVGAVVNPTFFPGSITYTVSGIGTLFDSENQVLLQVDAEVAYLVNLDPFEYELGELFFTEASDSLFFDQNDPELANFIGLGNLTFPAEAEADGSGSSQNFGVPAEYKVGVEVKVIYKYIPFYKLKGIVVCEENDEPIAGQLVELFTDEDVFVDDAITDVNGVFQLSVPAGQYIVSIDGVDFPITFTEDDDGVPYIFKLAGVCEEICWSGEGETAWAWGPRYQNPGSWATYTPYKKDTEIDVFASQSKKAGTVTFSAPDANGKITITILLEPGWRLNPAEDEQVKIQGYNSAPSGNPSPGGFQYKWSKSDFVDPTVLVLTGIDKKPFYGIHLDLEAQVPCDTKPPKDKKTKPSSNKKPGFSTNKKPGFSANSKPAFSADKRPGTVSKQKSVSSPSKKAGFPTSQKSVVPTGKKSVVTPNPKLVPSTDKKHSASPSSKKQKQGVGKKW